MKYRKKPVVIDASQWFKNGDHPRDYEGCLEANYRDLEGGIVRRYRHPDTPGYKPCEQCGITHHWHGWIDTLEQGHRVCPGDWIITGVAGEMYPCKPAIFEKTYDKVHLSIKDND